MLHFGIVRPEERGLITNLLGLAAVRPTLAIRGAPLAARPLMALLGGMALTKIAAHFVTTYQLF
jgi:hypothetical protein